MIGKKSMTCRIVMVGTTLLVATAPAIAAPPTSRNAKAKDSVFIGEIWDQTCAKRGSHVGMAKQAGIARGPNMARECTLECHRMGSPLDLYNSKAGKIYRLDDQQKAAQFAGEKVKVTGELNPKTNMIHVESMTAAG